MAEAVKNRWRPVAKVEELSAGKPRILNLDGLKIALFKIEGDEAGIYALEDVCTHDDGPVAEGNVEDCVIECPRHGAKFDIRTGEVLSMPAVTPIRTFPVRVVGSQIEVELPG